MKKSLWQVIALCGVIALSACSKQEQNADAATEPKDVPMSAAPAEPTAMAEGSDDAASEPTADDLADANAAPAEITSDTTTEAEDDTPIAEAVEIDDEAAATATADAEVVDEEEQK
ncbi:hypothetical protein [uncultured Moraxella sp.]|uniref:hypothetical protein n=1 Tax=uncultured Moraxella sp. TaxID=263769 RepID=UPI0025D4B069|nr:hypothetical protein [uncultured Moraxella sp.]